jgi:DNA-binding Lrp family transcriptional regulator
MMARRAPALDRIDVKILAGLQHSGRITIQELAFSVGLSPRATLERVRRLEAAGIIAGYNAVIDVAKLTRPVTVFAEIALANQVHHGPLERRLAALEEVVECWEVSGAVDYVARFACPDLAAYAALTELLIDDPKLGIARIVSHVALRPVRGFTGYPESLFTRKPA